MNENDIPSTDHFEHAIDSSSSLSHTVHDIPPFPDFTKGPEFDPSHHIASNSDFLSNGGVYHHKNTSVTFFSDDLNDEQTLNELPLNELLDDFENDEDIFNSMDVDNSNENNNEFYFDEGRSDSRSGTPEIGYENIDRSDSLIDRSESPITQLPDPPEYSNEIPSFYDSTKLHYPYKSPLDYSDEEFEKLNHFEFLKDLKYEEPPVLPVYLNSNLLNDSSNKNYKTYPYQYQESTVPHVNEIYRYRINDLNLMDKYSSQKVSGQPPQRPLYKRSNSSNSSASSALKTIHSLRNPSSNNNNNSSNHNPLNKLFTRHKLTRENSSNSVKSSSSSANSKLKHSDKLHLIERNMIPHHVMLNHLITCNLNKDGYVTSSCITRYNGKFITQIVYFSNDLEKL